MSKEKDEAATIPGAAEDAVLASSGILVELELFASLLGWGNKISKLVSFAFFVLFLVSFDFSLYEVVFVADLCFGSVVLVFSLDLLRFSFDLVSCLDSLEVVELGIFAVVAACLIILEDFFLDVESFFGLSKMVCGVNENGK